ncbi:hypothetical protein ACJJTC_000968 [Scirpophaga incertulas]
MFKIESYVTPILLSYVDKYVRDFKPADAQVSLWGGGVALHNLVLKADVLQQEVALPFTLVSGRIHELLIQVPWTKIMSEPIVVTIDTIECVLSLNPPLHDELSPPEPPSRSQVVEAPPGYMQALVRRIVSNIALRIHHLIVKYVQDDIILSLNVKHLAVDSAGPSWEPSFADIDQAEPVIRRLVRLDDLTLCLDRADSDGKIRFYQEPLLYRCQMDLRVLTRLVSANTRRASSLNVHLRSVKLAWGVTSDQLVLLLRLFRERPTVEMPAPPPMPKTSTVLQTSPLHVTSTNSAEPARQESWSDWAWSWLPSWADRDGAVEEATTPASAIPIYFVAYLDDVSLVFKVMELDSNLRRRARNILELRATHAAVKSTMRAPTLRHVCVGLRTITLLSRGKCICGKSGHFTSKDEPTIYVSKNISEETKAIWDWPVEDIVDTKIDLALDANETLHDSNALESNSLPQQADVSANQDATDSAYEMDALWHKMEPILYLEYNHERSPPQPQDNPYENPPIDFEYSDWAEICSIKVQIEPVNFHVTTSFLHRLGALTSILKELQPLPEPEVATRVLTVEECESLLDNLPQRRITVNIRELRIRLVPWDDASVENVSEPQITLDLELPKTTFVITGPLYPHRVCSAACQIPDESGPLWNGARLHVSGAVSAARGQLWAGDGRTKACARTDLRFVMHSLLNRHLFTRRESVLFSYSIKIREANICGSAARLLAAWQVPVSLLSGRTSHTLKHSTLAQDALNDEESVAIDVTCEEFSVRGYQSKNVNTHIISLQSARATAYHAPKGGEVKQAWLFSAPDIPTTTPYLRTAIQWCVIPCSNALDYVGMWTEPISFCVDPLFIAWLAYKPTIRPYTESQTSLSKNLSSAQFFIRRRPTPPRSSSSGRLGTRSGSGADVHVRPRSVGSSSEPSERREPKPAQNLPPIESSWWNSERAISFHERFRKTLVNIEFGLILIYMATNSASAVDCATVRDAMERHATNREPVLTASLGRLSMHSNSSKKNFWQEIRHDGPTFISEGNDNDDESFPWKLRLADVSCYTLEVKSNKISNNQTAGLRSHLKNTGAPLPKTVLELVTTTVTLSVVTKSLQYKIIQKKESKKQPEISIDEQKIKYFTTGVDFKPSTLKEFFRGPTKRKKQADVNTTEEVVDDAPVDTTASGPMVSLGVHLHADTPPLIVRLDHEQVHLVAAALHGLQHVLTLLQRGPLVAPHGLKTPPGGSTRSLIRSVSEMEELRTPSEETPSENRSELISIYESLSIKEPTLKMKTFFWFQWVLSRATLVVATNNVKLAFEIDDIISTVDLQAHYNQLKVKVASASVRHYRRTASDEWTAGVLSGRILEAREPTNVTEENHFISITVTQAQVSNLPANWKEELHPKLLEEKQGMDTMWEIYMTLAPLEAVIQPSILENIMSLVHELEPRSFCPLRTEVDARYNIRQWPFCYVSAGGLRLLVTSEEKSNQLDDTCILNIGKLTVSPHPENPICRRTLNNMESGWVASGGPFEGHQYELLVNNCAIHTAQFRQLVCQEVSEKELMKGTGSENPALKWSQPVIAPTITPLLHAVDVGCILAPAMYSGGVLVSGPAADFNLVTDCAVELSVYQVGFLQRLFTEFTYATNLRAREWHEEEKRGVCPYAPFLMPSVPNDFHSVSGDSVSVHTDDTLKNERSMEAGPSGAIDSGVDTMTTHSTIKTGSRCDDSTSNTKKTVSISCTEQMVYPSDYLEVYVTMGVIEISLYTFDDGSSDIAALRPPKVTTSPQSTEPSLVFNVVVEGKETNLKASESDESSVKSLNENIRSADVGKTKLSLVDLPKARKTDGNLPLLHVSLHQPNLYYWRKKTLKSFQVSLFNAWVGLGIGQLEGHWNAPLLLTAKGVPDPVTDIPPALATIKLTTSVAGNNTHGRIRVDIERPLQFPVCADRLYRLHRIIKLLQNNEPFEDDDIYTPTIQLPFLYRLRRALVNQSIQNMTIQMSQVSLIGSEGTVCWDSASLQVTVGGRPDHLQMLGAVSALLVAVGSSSDARHVLLHPLSLGLDFDAKWDVWRRGNGGAASCDPSVRISLALDHVTLDVRPSELGAIVRLQRAIRDLYSLDVSASAESYESDYSLSVLSHRSTQSDTEVSDHYYKDDLRSGAFKIVRGGQLPMAYQVTMQGQSVAWRYPHPRTITRVLAFPLPDQEKEINCVLEFYSTILESWNIYTYFTVPGSAPKEVQLYLAVPDAVFSQMWRFRPCTDNEAIQNPFVFDINHFMPRSDPLKFDRIPNMECPISNTTVTAEQLSGAIRIDSYFAPKALPRIQVATRMVGFELNLHNSLPSLASNETALEGYYVSRPLIRSHRVLTLVAKQVCVYLHLGAQIGYKLMLSATIGCDVLNCGPGTMEPFVSEFLVEAAMSAVGDVNEDARACIHTSNIHISLQVPRTRTLHALANDWMVAFRAYTAEMDEPPTHDQDNNLEGYSKQELAAVMAKALDGRISLWIYNSCAVAVRIGQEETEEIVPVGPGVRLAYRWRSPTAKMMIRIAIVGPTTEWHWSSGVPFTSGSYRVRLEDNEALGSKATPGSRVYAYIRVKESGARRTMHIAGRLVLANMLRYNLLYKVRARFTEGVQWRTISSGELSAECIGPGVLCSADCDLVLKIKFTTHDTSWSGDIPLKECPKENVPWLVKVPSEGEIPYVSVWCRVVRARNDGRVLATVWPLYVLYSHLPLDTDVLIVTENNSDCLPSAGPSHLIQSATGRGALTHILAPGTTAARHKLSFQYRNIECPVTKDAVPLFYGVTDTSVFDKQAPVTDIDEVVQDITLWLKRSERNTKSSWPYSVVRKHWPGQWQAALLQPRSDVTIRYQAIRAGGGCSLELQMYPVVLLCNAAPIAFTLRAYDAAPLCKLEPGTAISPPSTILKKPFFISVEVGRETFVSGALEVSDVEPGRYGSPPPGHVTLQHPTSFAIQCNQKVALLTMYYEVKEEINVLGVSTTFELVNNLDTKILASAIVIPQESATDILLRPKSFMIVEPSKDFSTHGSPLCRFWLSSRWRGQDPSELVPFLCLSLAAGSYPANVPVPLRLGVPPYRRAFALVDSDNNSIPVVVSQVKHEGRWVVVVSFDECPQFVVSNRTNEPLALAQPRHNGDEPSPSHTTAVPDCEGVRWWCTVNATAVTHYSSPSHCARFPPQANGPSPDTSKIQYITLGVLSSNEEEPSWCPPVAITDGEQLLQLHGGLTVKMRVRTHPHSTFLDFQDVDQTDISASDIRKRLQSPFLVQEKCLAENIDTHINSVNLERVNAEELYSSEREANAKGHTGSQTSYISHKTPTPDWKDTFGPWPTSERLRFVGTSLSLELSANAECAPLLALHLERIAVLLLTDEKGTRTTVAIAGLQVDNLQYETGQFDFPVVVSAPPVETAEEQWPTVWSMLMDRDIFSTRQENARVLLHVRQDRWTVVDQQFNELTEVELSVGPLALYVEDAYVSALVELGRLALPPTPSDETASTLAEIRTLQRPLRLQALMIHPLDLTLTLHTAMRMYIALDQSPLHLSAFKLKNVMTSVERLSHALTVHYLSAAILGAGWVVGGLELLGAPGALAARVGGASGGVRGVASAAAAALLRSLSACAGSLARNLDLLAGDEEHARRAAAARRRPPPSLVAGLIAGITNFAINILGAVGGLAHHPFVGVAVGETGSSATALRRGLLGALTKPLSATADLVAYAGHGLLTQTGWDPVPQPRASKWSNKQLSDGASDVASGWRRDCVRWAFRLAEPNAICGFEVLLDNALLQLVITHKFLVVADPESERVLEMIDWRFCSLGPYNGNVINLSVTHRRTTKSVDRVVDEDDEYQINAAAMARVARYTGSSSGSGGESRKLELVAAAERAPALHAVLAAVLRHNSDSHFSLL